MIDVSQKDVLTIFGTAIPEKTTIAIDNESLMK